MAQIYSQKTPLRYPGGKSRAMKVLGDHFPSDMPVYHEPFLGGGSVAIWVTQAYPNTDVWVNDLYGSLYTFWTQLRDNCSELQKAVREIKDTVKDDKGIGKSEFNRMKDQIIETDDPLVIASYFYALNKMSFSGLTESRSSYSNPSQISNFTYLGINKMQGYSHLIQRWRITNLDYRELLQRDDALVFLDPPYEIKSNLYGRDGETHESFNHDDFANACNNASCKQFITYNADQKVQDRFPSWKQIVWDLKYSMCTNSKNYVEQEKDRKELILLNYEEDNTLAQFF